MLEHNYLYKNSQTLKNRYGIKNPQRFYERCAHDAAKEAINFRDEPPPQKFDAAYLKLIHWSLFHNAFEWAGQTRDQIFTFKDGTKARMPAMRPKGHAVPFAVGPQLQRELRALERMLHMKNNLCGLSRQKFAESAAEVFMLLDHAHPFRKGNGRTQRMFMEKLGQAAGHKIDFSSVTKERMIYACVEAMQHNNPEPMQHLFEDITHPQKTLVLKEFISQMRNAGLDEINNRIVVAAKEGETYDGIYKGCSSEGFVIEVDGFFVVGHKDDLLPEQVKTLKNGTRICFEKSNVKSFKETLIPKETLEPLTLEELSARVESDPFVEACRKKIEDLSKIVYGNRKVLDTKMNLITADPALSEEFSAQITQNPKSIHKLAGLKILSIKSPDRRRAENHIPQLGEAFKNYALTVRLKKEEVLEQHQREQKRLSQAVEKPGRDLQNLFSLPPEQQRDALSQSLPLQQQLHAFARQLQSRLSSEDRKAIQDNDHTRLSCMLGLSKSKAKEIAQTVKLTKEAQCQLRTLKVSRSASIALTG
ncbi:cell filamentation protein [Bartonella callosciuri]|uniref:protein adenylyltransferase n=1 Tax=Bartonella callosciuri TaxID=686223 RepID=A0A840NMR0_9HYPH|nr:BID domain-containing T4SS effector [Bartonella callosciuri]MBB5073986.1 cell filamentation protein [Bartonella callosciuri]